MHRFADSPLANILSFTYKTKQALHISQFFFFSHDTKKSDTHAYTLLLKPLIRQKKFSNWPNTLMKWHKTSANRRWSKQLIGDTNGKIIHFFIVINDNDDDDNVMMMKTMQDDADHHHHHLLLFTHNYHAKHCGLWKPSSCNFRVVSNSIFQIGVRENS